MKGDRGNKMTFHTPPEKQGQIVEVSYVLIDGEIVLRRTIDRSNGITEYAESSVLDSDNGEYWNGAPANKRWRKLSPREVAYVIEGGKES